MVQHKTPFDMVKAAQAVIAIEAFIVTLFDSKYESLPMSETSVCTSEAFLAVLPGTYVRKQWVRVPCPLVFLVAKNNA
jgi:hypothetical protein